MHALKLNDSDRERIYFWLGLTSVVVLLAFGLTLVWGMGKLINQFLYFLKSADPQIAAQIIGTSGTVITAVVAVVIGHIYTKRRDIRESQRIAKAETYNVFVKQITAALMDGTPSESVLKQFFKDFTSRLLLAGSEEVVLAFNEWRDSNYADLKQTFLTLDTLLRALRRDLGHSNRGLPKGALVRIYFSPEAQKQALENH